MITESFYRMLYQQSGWIEYVPSWYAYGYAINTSSTRKRVGLYTLQKHVSKPTRMRVELVGPVLGTSVAFSACKRNPFAVDKTFLRHKAFFVLHVWRAMYVVTQIQELDFVFDAMLDLFEYRISSQAFAFQVWVEKRIDRRHTFLSLITNRHS